MSELLRRIEAEIARDVLDSIIDDGLAVLDATEHRDECLAYLHVVLRRAQLRYGARLLREELPMGGVRGGLSATPMQHFESNGSATAKEG
jgi:hypothetical protein